MDDYSRQGDDREHRHTSEEYTPLPRTPLKLSWAAQLKKTQAQTGGRSETRARGLTSPPKERTQARVDESDRVN